MSQGLPTDIIVLSGVVMTGSTVIRRVSRKQKEYMRTVLFGFMLTFVLLLIAVPLPTFAKGLAYLGMVGALLVNGPDILALVNGLVK